MIGMEEESETRLPGWLGRLSSNPTLWYLAVGTSILVVEPVAAQTGIDLLREGVCGGQGAQLLAAVWAAGVVYYGGFGIFRLVTGASKFGSSDPSEQTEGKERIKGAGWSIGAALLLLSAERILAFVGIPMLECINLGFV